MFKFKKKDRSSKVLRTTEVVERLKASDPIAPAPATSDPVAARLGRFNSTTSTMLSDDVEDVFYQRGGTEVFHGSRDTTASTTRSLPPQPRMTSSHHHDTTSVRSLHTLTEDNDPATQMPLTPDAPDTIATLRTELAGVRDEMQAIKREMMNEMHTTRYDMLKEVTMLKGTILQLVQVLQAQTPGGVLRFDSAGSDASSTGTVVPAATVDPVLLMATATMPPAAPAAELSTDEREALTRRTTTVTSRSTRERITATREDQVPPILRSSARLTQLAPVDDSALSTPLHQEQIDDMFPLIDGSADVQVQARIRETGTRDWTLERVQEWLDSRLNVGADTVLAIVGDAGAGKTVAAGAIADQYPDHAVAVHFCKFDRKAKSSPRNVLLSLVNQLTRGLPGFKSQLARLNLRYVLEETDPLVLARKVLIDPLNALEEPLTAKFILIDAVDQCRLPNGHNELLEFLAVVVAECPKWLGFIVTTKPSADFASKIPVTSVLDFSAANAQYAQDPVALIQDIANVFHDDDMAEAKAILAAKSGGNYAYLEFTKQALSHPGMEEPDGFIPVDVLHDLPETLYEIYAEIFEDKFGKGRNRLWRKAQPVLELVVSAAAGPYQQITEQQILDQLGYTKDEVRMLRRAFLDVISIRKGTYNIISSALFEWLTDPQRRNEQFFVDVAVGVKTLRKLLRGDSLRAPGALPTAAECGGSSRSVMSSTSSSSSSSSGSDRGSNDSTRAAPPVPRRHEPSTHAPTNPRGILKRAKA